MLPNGFPNSPGLQTEELCRRGEMDVRLPSNQWQGFTGNSKSSDAAEVPLEVSAGKFLVESAE